ncbi:MAG: biopolymer transporter ExbD [Thermoflexibacter sp.]|jgi:biopolymer transport protein ExbD|nr:biopolymer transporter ExbD [Thermoflexibacter sp.]
MIFTKKVNRKGSAEVNASSMADIAFLLLIFFLVTTTIASDKGLSMRLPPYLPDQPTAPVKDRNVLNILVNSQNQLLADEQLIDLQSLKNKIKEFIVNASQSEKLSENPQKAIVSVKTDRGTNYAIYVNVLDEVKRSYHELRAVFLGISLEEYLDMVNTTPENLSKEQKNKLEQAQQAYPMQISEAEPSSVEK